MPAQNLLAGPHHGWETVLVVAESEAERGTLGSRLRRSGYQVLEARHGGQALLRCVRQPGPIHLVVTHLDMPDMTGRDLVGAIASLRPQIKALYIADAAGRPAGPSHPAADYEAALERPFTPNALAWKVREILDR